MLASFLRFVRVGIATFLSVALADLASWWLWGDLSSGDPYMIRTHFLTLPFLVFVPQVPLAWVGFFVVDRLAPHVPALQPAIRVWPVAAGLGTVAAGFISPSNGFYFLFFLAYWLLAGRLAGRPGLTANPRDWSLGEKLMVGVLTALLPGLVLIPGPQKTDQRPRAIAAGQLALPDGGPVSARHDGSNGRGDRCVSRSRVLSGGWRDARAP